MKHGDINAYLKNNPATPRLPLAVDVASGLWYLHENDIIHGDLKGPNILIDDAGQARLADFGISGVSDSNIIAWTSQSSGGSQGGSVRWQAPELFDVQNDAGVKNSTSSDVYAWGCVAYEENFRFLTFRTMPLLCFTSYLVVVLLSLKLRFGTLGEV
ncbi:hypothetical protein H0H92_007360 [Tricholoma furcatifolium]|nr:hypothetical protein H0H92_007360 [Tricholoma furcatifolium]